MDGQWQVVRPEQIPALGRKMQGWASIAFDTEATGVEPYMGDKPIGIGLSPMEEEKYYYLPLEGLNLLDLRPILEPLEQKPLVGHNIKFDLHMLSTLGWRGQQDCFFDTIVMARLWSAEERQQLGLKDLGQQIFQYQYEDLSAVKAAKAGKLNKVPLEEAAKYCCTDVWLTKRLYNWFKQQLPSTLKRLFIRESYLTKDLFDIEALGILIDQEYLNYAIGRLDKELASLLDNIGLAVPDLGDFNPASTPQVRQLMASLGIKPVAHTPKGEPSWNREACLKVRHRHPVALQLAKHRALSYQRNGLIDRALDFVKAGSQELHFEFKNWGTVTGRLSGNSQQMPKDWLQFGTEAAGGEDVLVWAKGPEQDFSIRRLLRPRPGKALIKADYRQIEMFVLGSYMKDPTFTRWLDSGNVHSAAALEVFGDAEKHYAKGKEFNFAIVYGVGDKALCKRNGWKEEETQLYRAKYNARMPGYRPFLRKVRRLLEKDGFVSNIYGRQYRVDPDLAYKALNYLCQGSAGDFVKFRLPETRQLRRQIGLDILNTTHDDFVAEIDETEVRHLPEWLGELRKSPFGRPLEMDTEYSMESLVQLHPIEELIHAA